MAEAMRRSAKEGATFGVLAGIVFAIAEIIAAALMGSPPLTPLRMFASVILGSPALETTSLGVAVVVGILAHLVLSAVFGLVYGLANGRLSREVRTNWAAQAGLGAGYGLLVWIVNFQIIARIVYPWFLMAPQFTQAVLHALFFGLPLGLMYAAAEQRVVRRAPASAPG